MSSYQFKDLPSKRKTVVNNHPSSWIIVVNPFLLSSLCQLTLVALVVCRRLQTTRVLRPGVRCQSATFSATYIIRNSSFIYVYKLGVYTISIFIHLQGLGSSQLADYLVNEINQGPCYVNWKYLPLIIEIFFPIIS